MIDVTEIRCLDSVDVDVTKLAWRFDEAGAGLDSAAWSLDSDVTEIRSLDSVDVDATKPAWRFDAVQIRSLDTKLGLCGRGSRWMRQNRRGGTMRPIFKAWIPCRWML